MSTTLENLTESTSHFYAINATGIHGNIAFALEKQKYGGNTWGTRGDALRLLMILQ
jgi:hypothetical protein